MVTTNEHLNKARNWLSGSFHEMQYVALILEWSKVARLHQALARVKEIRDGLGS